METSNQNVRIGIVIPIINLKYLEVCLYSILRWGLPSDAVICIVNDGNFEIRSFLDERYGQKIQSHLHWGEKAQGKGNYERIF